MVIDTKLFRRRIIIGYNSEPTLRFGIHRERSFTAYGLWPIIIGISK